MHTSLGKLQVIEIMALSLNKPKLDNLASGRKSAEWLRGKFKAEYQSLILPILVIRRLECVLEGGEGGRGAQEQT